MRDRLRRLPDPVTVPASTVRIGPAPQIAVDFLGKGELVLFLHGLGGNRSNWQQQLPVIGTEYLATAWDARGYGDSDDYAGPLAFEDFLSDIDRILAHFDAPAAHLVGLSMGGMIAMEFALRQPQRLRSLTLCDTLPGFAAAVSQAQVEEFIRIRREPLLGGLTPRDIAPRLAQSLIRPGCDASVVKRVEESIAALRTESYLKTMETTSRFVLSAAPQSIRVRTLLIYGADDSLTPPSLGRSLQTAIAGSRLEILPEAGHMSNIDAPDLFNATLLSFLREPSRSHG